MQPVLNNSLVNVSFFIGFMIVGKFFVLNMVKRDKPETAFVRHKCVHFTYCVEFGA